MQKKKDIALIKRCLDNNRQAQKQLVDSYGPAMYANILRYVKKEDEAQDLLQEVFISVFQALPKFKGKSTLGHWIKTITMNKVFKNAKSRWNRHVDSNAVPEDYDTVTLDSIEDQLFADDIMKKVDGLPDINRVVFLMHTVEGYGHNEIGKLLGISEEGSRSRLYKARKLLIDMFSQQKINL